MNLHKVLGRYVTLSEITVPEFYEQLPNTQEEITRLALGNNPSIKVAYYEMMAAKSDYKASRKNYLPSVDFELSASYTDNLSGIESTNKSASAFVYLNYNLFNGFRDSNYAQKKISTVYQKYEELNKVRRDVMESIQLAWGSFRITSKQSIFVNWYLKSSKDKLNSYYREFNVNSQQRSLIDLLGASDDYNNARRKMINTKYDLIFARYRLLDAMGDLSSALNIAAKETVGLGYKTKPSYRADNLPVDNDKDRDSIIDSKDICTGSETNSTINHYGCVNKVRSNYSDFNALEQFLLENMDDKVKDDKIEEDNSELDDLE